jgi:hypothetical protein
MNKKANKRGFILILVMVLTFIVILIIPLTWLVYGDLKITESNIIEKTLTAKIAITSISVIILLAGWWQYYRQKKSDKIRR